MIPKLMAALFSGRLHEFARIPFQQFEVKLTDGSSIAITTTGTPKRDKKRHTVVQAPLQLTLTPVQGKPQQVDLELKPPMEMGIERMLQLEVPWLERVDADRWLDSRIGQLITTPEMLTRYAEALPPSLRSKPRRGRDPHDPPCLLYTSPSPRD